MAWIFIEKIECFVFFDIVVFWIVVVDFIVNVEDCVYIGVF